MCLAHHAAVHATVCVQELLVDEICQLDASSITVVRIVPFEMKGNAADIGCIVRERED